MEKPAFPLPPASFTGTSQRAEAGACFDWLRQAWAFFMANPGVWIAATVVLILVYLALQVVPFIGSLAANLLLPLFSAGMLSMCRKLSQGDDIGLSDLFAGFQGSVSNGLIVVGALNAAALFVIVLIAGILAGGGLLGGVMMARPAGLGVVFGGFLFALLIASVLSVPVLMAMWFAPALVFFHGMPPVAALKASFHACASNWLPMLVYGLFLSVLVFFATLPIALGWLLLIPILYGTVYVSYRDIFPGS